MREGKLLIRVDAVALIVVVVVVVVVAEDGSR